MLPPTAFGSNFSGAAFCLPHQLVGVLLLFDLGNGTRVDLPSSTHYISGYFRINVASKVTHSSRTGGELGVHKRFQNKC